MIPGQSGNEPDRQQRLNRNYVQLQKTDELARLMAITEPRAARAAVRAYMQENVASFRENRIVFDVLDLPSKATLMRGKEQLDVIQLLESLTVSISVSPEDARLLTGIAMSGNDPDLRFFGTDAPIYAGRSWSPGFDNGRSFQDRSAADRMLGADALQQDPANPLMGTGVNVVLMDSGLDSVERQQLGLTFDLSFIGNQHQIYSAQTTPEQARYGHAWGIARQLKHLAGNATIHDFAILPPRLSKASVPAMGVQVPAFISDVVTAFAVLNGYIALQRANGNRTPWVIVNSWSVFERTWVKGTDLDTPQAWLNWLISRTVQLGADVVFAAGNCGQFGADMRCGPKDKGPGCSIVGPNGHPDVLTVGAVRSDDIWLGYSSQGPGIMANTDLARQKPDLCVPSEFRDGDDAAMLNTGTSSACGIAGAVIAALRQGFPNVPPAKLKQVLIDTARQPGLAGWSPRTGHGVLDLRAAKASLEAALAPAA